jgi:diguanylate cyclase (GGDEF)-like protein/PAS domain S-box-containing protein
MTVSPPSKRILLIQNDAPAAIAILGALNHSGDECFEVEWVRHCSEALERLDGAAALLLDLCLPDSQGLDTFHRLFRAAPAIPILVLIEPGDEKFAKLAVQGGAQDYLFKNCADAHLLCKAVASMIERATFSEALFEEQERARITLNSIGDAVVSTNLSGTITYLNAIAEGLTGWSRQDATGHPLTDIFHIIDATTRKPVGNPMTLAIQANRTVALGPNCVLIRRDGAEAAIEDSAAPIHDRRGAVTGAVMVFHDVSAARAMTLRLSYLAQHDSLTDLPNRVLLNDRLTEAIALSSRYGRKLAVLFVDLDRFKNINDSLGHAVGDRLLQSVARRLFACVRGSDTVGRQGGDEFVVLLQEVSEPQDAAITAVKILETLREPHYINEHELHITASVGIVTYPDDGTDAETLMNKVDQAMYHAKQAGRDSYQFFEREINERAIERRALEDGLFRAIERQQLELYYQPKFDLSSGAIIGAEALLRWQHPQRGLILPDRFIAIAEDCGLIVPLGQWVLREACRQAKAWQLAGLQCACMAVNVSSLELRAPGFVSGVRQALKESGLDPRYLEIELTETGLMSDSGSIVAVLNELKAVGVQLALDDFGTGYSSLSHLKYFPIDTIKIDQSFVRDLGADDDSTNIVTALIGMGKNLRMRVVAEGIETRLQWEILREHACPQGQGFLFSRPVPAEEFGRLLRCDAGTSAALT